MNLQKALNQAAYHFGYRDYLHAQTLSHNNNPWWFIDEVILGDPPLDTPLSQYQANHPDERLGEKDTGGPSGPSLSFSPADAKGMSDNRRVIKRG